MTRVLVLNAGSSGLKWTVLSEDERVLSAGNALWTSERYQQRVTQIRYVLDGAGGFEMVGHRVVHGGRRFVGAARVDATVRTELEQLADLDPQHMQLSLAGVDAVTAAQPATLQVVAFDTAFHATLPEAAAGYALPLEWTERWDLRRFGFHGLSVAYAVSRTEQMLGRMPRRMIVCHLGGGCSVTAVEDGRSVDTTMGFSPLEGLVMSTRSGSVDPGLLLFLLERRGISVSELREALTYHSGLLGMSGVSGDLREIMEAADDGVANAQLAYDRFIRSVRSALGAMTGVLGGVDAVVFTGGIGENSARVRTDAARALTPVGLELGKQPMTSTDSDFEVSASGSRVRVLVIRSREDLVILREVLRLQRLDAM